MVDQKGPLLWPSCLWLRSKQLGRQVVSDGSWGTGWGPSLSGWQGAGNLPVTLVSGGIFPSPHTICFTHIIGPPAFEGQLGICGLCAGLRVQIPAAPLRGCVTSGER